MKTFARLGGKQGFRDWGGCVKRDAASAGRGVGLYVYILSSFSPLFYFRPTKGSERRCAPALKLYEREATPYSLLFALLLG